MTSEFAWGFPGWANRTVKMLRRDKWASVPAFLYSQKLLIRTAECSWIFWWNWRLDLCLIQCLLWLFMFQVVSLWKYVLSKNMTCFTLESLIIKLSWLGLCQLSPCSEWTLYCFAIHVFRLPEHWFWFVSAIGTLLTLCQRPAGGTGCSYLKCLNNRNLMFSPGQEKWYRCPTKLL